MTQYNLEIFTQPLNKSHGIALLCWFRKWWWWNWKSCLLVTFAARKEHSRQLGNAFSTMAFHLQSWLRILINSLESPICSKAHHLCCEKHVPCGSHSTDSWTYLDMLLPIYTSITSVTSSSQSFHSTSNVFIWQKPLRENRTEWRNLAKFNRHFQNGSWVSKN